jgi:glyoxylase-like metal-dependent hydrolase (beta-lactamase superfamily II)
MKRTTLLGSGSGSGSVRARTTGAAIQDEMTKMSIFTKVLLLPWKRWHSTQARRVIPSVPSPMASLEIVEVAAGIWSVRRGRRGSASYVVNLDPGGILIDAGSEPTGADVMQCLQAARVGLRSIRAILLTHAHEHAASGARALRERSGAPVLSSRAEAVALARGDGTGRRIIPRTGGAPEGPFEPDSHLADGERVEPFFRVLATPGHSRGHLAFWLEPLRLLFCGDALSLRDGSPELASGTSDPEEASASLRKCLALEPELLLPAHGDPGHTSLLSGRRDR